MNHSLDNKNIGIGITGSYCTYKKVFNELKRLSEANTNLYTIFSDNASKTDSRFGNHKEFLNLAKELSNKEPITTITDAEPIGPKSMFDVLVIAPCTGNTLSKLANGISDTPVLMACKAHLRNNKPLVICLSTNDALGMNLKNIGILLILKIFILFLLEWNDYISKPNSMTAHVDLLQDTIVKALQGRQIQPVIQSPHVTIT